MSFKVAADPVIFALLNSKQFPRGNSGKFVTIYPANLPQFKAALEDLYRLTGDRALSGPYILSDRRYRDSRVLHYRYGGFRPIRRLRADGTTSLHLIAPDGGFVDDERLPYYRLPPWVSEPFAMVAPDPEADADVRLAGRYRIDGALYYSNSGGVYEGIDDVTGTPVVIKEARPGTNCWRVGDRVRDAPYFLQREYSTLRHLRGVPGIPAAIDLFDEWEHRFLVEGRAAGITLESYFAQEDRIIAPYIHRPGRLEPFVTSFAAVALELIKLLTAVHRRGIVLGDLSPRNIMINPADQSISLIDFESAIAIHGEADLRDHAQVWATPGFLDEARVLENRDPRPQDDIFALGRVLLSLLVPINQFLALKPGSQHEFVNAMVDHGLPPEIPGVLADLEVGNAESAVTRLSGLAAGGPTPEPARQPPRRDRPSEGTTLETSVIRIREHILRTAEFERTDCLWPADYTVFSTSPLSVAYGACGTAMFLHDADSKGVPSAILDWIRHQPITLDQYPPGLFTGLAGISLAFLRFGLTSEAEALLDQALRSPLLFADPGFYLGVAGWGFACLQMYQATGDGRWVDQSERAGAHLLALAERGTVGSYWTTSLDAKVHHGYGYGSSGIALFLAQLFAHTRERRWADSAVSAMEFDLDHAVTTGVGRQWRQHLDGSIVYPYWIHGSAGIGAVLLRCANLLERDDWFKTAQDLADENFVVHSVVPGQFIGLAGIGEFMLDVFVATGNARFCEHAHAVADAILRFGFDRRGGLAFPGRSLARVSNDYGTGSAGIGSFLNRLSTGTPDREFFDIGARGHARKIG